MNMMENLPRPVFARVKSLPKGSHKPMHSHPWAQFTYASKGVLVIHTDQGTYFTPPLWAVWIPPGIQHEVITSVETERRNFLIELGKIERQFTRCLVLEVTPFMRELIQMVAELPVEYEEDGPEGRLAQVFFDQIARMREASFSVPMPTTPSLFKFCTELLRTPEEQHLVHGLARTLGMSERTMARVFQRETGLSFREWRVRLKLLMSVEWLKSSRNVTATAFNCGYDSASAFISAFKKQFSTTPGEFLKHL
jgi:AraC-like DNA-binding protein